MAKLTTINYDETGREVITLSDMPERPVTATAKTSVEKRIPSSPHKPFTSRNFYDLTNTTPENPKLEMSTSQGTKGFMMPPSIDDDVIVIPGPFARDAQGRKVSVQNENTPSLMQGERKGASLSLLIQLLISLIQQNYFLQTRLSGSHRK
jgi:hypothetical protein